MAIFSGHVAVGADDFDIESVANPDTTGTTDTTIDAKQNRDSGSVATVQQIGYIDLDTSGIDSSWTINSAILRWYTHAYNTAPKADPEGSHWEMKNLSDVWTTIESSTANRTVGWESYTLDGTERGYIRDSGTTSFRFHVSDPVTANQIRNWSVRSYEHTPSNAYSVWLEVDYTAPAAWKKRRIFIIG